MSDVSLQIDGKTVTVRDDMSVLDAARSAGVSIPTVCHHEKLEPFGGCRLCVVEAEAGGRTNVVAACIYPVQNGMVVRTRSVQIDRIRKVLTEQLLAHAPESEVLQKLAREYRADKDRFPKEPSFCILCGLCVRYCAEVKKEFAVGFMDRGPNREISFVPQLAQSVCWDCKECFPLCPTSALQAAYVLTRSMASFRSPATSGKSAGKRAAAERNDGSPVAGEGDNVMLQVTATR